MDIQAVLFDCDGTMFDTEIVSQRIWQETADKLHFELPEGFFVEITGGSSVKKFETLPGFEQLWAQMRQKRMDLSFWSSIQYDCLNKKGLISLFTYLYENHYRVAICSSSPSHYVKALLERVSVPLHYDEMVCGDMVTHKKPDPEIFLTAAKHLQIKPENCLVVEDSKNGILAAHRAHMHTCFIYDTIALDEEMKPLVEYNLNDLEEVIHVLRQAASKVVY